MTTSAKSVRNAVLKDLLIPSFAYLLATAGAAYATPMLGGRNPAFAIWLGGCVVLFLALARAFNRAFRVSSLAGRLSAALVSAFGVSVVVASIGFVLMVNIWERLGLGH